MTEPSVQRRFLDSIVLPESAHASAHTRELRQGIIDWLEDNHVKVKMGGYFQFLGIDMSAEKLAQQIFRDKSVGYEVDTHKDDPPTKWKLAAEKEIKADLDNLGLALFSTAVAQCRKVLVAQTRVSDDELRRAAATIMRQDVDPDKYEYYVIALKQLIWQVKQKLAGRRSQHDIFVLFYSLTQGSGKTTWINKFGSVLGPLFMQDVDFDLFRDKFRIKAFNRYYLAFIDEMAKASQKDLGAVKKAITKQSVGGREMHSDNDFVMEKNVNFIAASNRQLIEDLQDPSGTRRWVEIGCVEEKASRNPERMSQMNSIDWSAVWAAVHVDDPSPYGAHFELVVKQQDENKIDSDFVTFCDEYMKPALGCSVKNTSLFEAFARVQRTHNGAIPTPQIFGRWVKDRFATKKLHNALYAIDVALIVEGEL